MTKLNVGKEIMHFKSTRHAMFNAWLSRLFKCLDKVDRCRQAGRTGGKRMSSRR